MGDAMNGRYSYAPQPNLSGFAPAAHGHGMEAVAGLASALNGKAPLTSPSFTGAVGLAPGSAAAPALAFTGDTDTGLLRPAPDTLGFATGGVQRTTLDSGGALVQGHTAGVGIGGTGGSSPVVQAHGTSWSSGIGVCRWDGASVYGAQLSIAKSRGTAVGTRGAVQSGDECGRVWFTADDGSTFLPAADIRSWVDGTPVAGSVPGMLAFGTTPAAGSIPVERLRIGNDGTVTHRSNMTVVIDANSHLGLRSYTVATLPSAAAAGRLICVSNGAGNKRLAVSDGAGWRWPDGALVS